MSQSRTGSSYYLLGPVGIGGPPNNQFFFAYSGKSKSGDNVAYFLTLLEETNEIGQTTEKVIFDPRINLAGTQNDINVEVSVSETLASNSVPIGDLLILTAENASGGWNYSFTGSDNSTRYLTVDSNSNLTTSDTPTAFSAIQNQVADWPDIPFLAGVGYTFQVNGKQVNAETYQANKVIAQTVSGVRIPKDITIVTETDPSTGTTSPVTSMVTSTVRAVSALMQFTGMSGGVRVCNASQVPIIAQVAESEWVFSGLGFPAFTTKSECDTGVRYSYCNTGQTCGTSNCKGPCNNSDNPNDTCQYDTSNSSFVCKRNETNKHWYENPWFLLIVVIGVILIFTLVIIMIIRFEHNSKSD